MQRFPWKRGQTFYSIALAYVQYVKKFSNATFLFDGYENELSTKHVAHLIRSKGVIGPEVLFDGSMLLKSKKDHFLTNENNKQKFIYFLSEKLQSQGVQTLHSKGDADLCIALTGVKKAKCCHTCHWRGHRHSGIALSSC